MTDSNPPGVVLTSCGHRHAPPPAASLTYDVQTPLHNPAADPSMRFRTGHDDDVRAHVLATPGARDLILTVVRDVLAALPADDASEPVTVAVVCAGGRHRSVVVADAAGAILGALDVPAAVHHRDIGRPVLAALTA